MINLMRAVMKTVVQITRTRRKKKLRRTITKDTKEELTEIKEMIEKMKSVPWSKLTKHLILIKSERLYFRDLN